MEEFREPKKGDVIWADRTDKGLPYYHCGIYEGGGYVIHYAPKGKGFEISQKNAVVHETTLDKFKDGCKLRIVEFPEGFSAEETLRRARSRIGEKDYNFATNNCDHFATWCKTGEHRSIQADEAKKFITVLGGDTGKKICAVHDMVEAYKAPALNSADMIQKQKKIAKILKQNSFLTTVMPPAAEDIDNSQDVPEYKLIEKEPVDAVPEVKKAWYEKVGDVLKFLIIPISGALEFAKRIGILPPPFNKIDYLVIGAKVCNGIDKVVIAIKDFTGKLTPVQAHEELLNNETALLGQLASGKQRLPIREMVKNVFGKVGSTIGHLAQQVVSRTVPQPVLTAIKTGFQTIGKAAVSGIKAGAAKAVGLLKSAGRAIKSAFGGKK